MEGLKISQDLGIYGRGSGIPVTLGNELSMSAKYALVALTMRGNGLISQPSEMCLFDGDCFLLTNELEGRIVRSSRFSLVPIGLKSSHLITS